MKFKYYHNEKSCPETDGIVQLYWVTERMSLRIRSDEDLRIVNRKYEELRALVGDMILSNLHMEKSIAALLYSNYTRFFDNDKENIINMLMKY